MPDELVYVVIQEDRHLDPVALVFAQRESAVEFAKTTAREHSDELNESLTESMQQEGWIYHVVYSVEDDRLYVYPTNIR